MRGLFLTGLLLSSVAQAQTLPAGVTATTVYEMHAPNGVPGAFSVPWSSSAEGGFSMNGHAFVVYAMPSCATQWSALPDPIPAGAYGTLIIVDPIGAGNSLYVAGTGLRLGDAVATQNFACF